MLQTQYCAHLKLHLFLFYSTVKALTDFNSYNLNALKYISKTETVGLEEVNAGRQKISR